MLKNKVEITGWITELHLNQLLEQTVQILVQLSMYRLHGKVIFQLFLIKDIPCGETLAISYPPHTCKDINTHTDTLLSHHNQPLSVSAPNRKGPDYKHTAIIYEAAAKNPVQ